MKIGIVEKLYLQPIKHKMRDYFTLFLDADENEIYATIERYRISGNLIELKKSSFCINCGTFSERMRMRDRNIPFFIVEVLLNI